MSIPGVLDMGGRASCGLIVCGGADRDVLVYSIHLLETSHVGCGDVASLCISICIMCSTGGGCISLPIGVTM